MSRTARVAALAIALLAFSHLAVRAAQPAAPRAAAPAGAGRAAAGPLAALDQWLAHLGHQLSAWAAGVQRPIAPSPRPALPSHGSQRPIRIQDGCSMEPIGGCISG